MREELGKINGVRGKFSATITKIGRKNNFKGAPSETVLFTDVRNEAGERVAEHVWFTIGKKLSGVLNNVGKKVTFEARVTEYVKGYKGNRLEMLKPKEKDFRLSNPTHVAIIHNTKSG